MDPTPDMGAEEVIRNCILSPGPSTWCHQPARPLSSPGLSCPSFLTLLLHRRLSSAPSGHTPTLVPTCGPMSPCVVSQGW